MSSQTVSITAPPRSRSRAALRVVQPPSGVDLVAAEQAAAAFLVALGVDLDTESLAATPARMARAYAEMFSPRPFDLTTFPNDAGYDELIIADRSQCSRSVSIICCRSSEWLTSATYLGSGFSASPSWLG
jgi:hypothetical protein